MSDDQDNPLANVGVGPGAPSWLLANDLSPNVPVSNAITQGVGTSTSAMDPLASGASKLQPPAQIDDATARQSVLNKIASGEAPNYNTIYGGGQFSDFGDHPRQSVPIQDKPGMHSDAAGRYQFLSSTWDKEKQKLGLKDFSPDNQDSAAWDYANTSYKDKTGRDLLTDAKSGKVQWGALSAQWPSLASAKDGPGLASSEYRGDNPIMQKIASTGENSSQEKNVQANNAQSPDPRGMLKLALLQAAFPHLEFSPINYDPSKIAADEHVG